MTRVFCFSGSGHSRAVADFFAEGLHTSVEEIDRLPFVGQGHIATAVVVFPVYCQNIPPAVKAFLKLLDSRYIILIATYRKIAHGNVLWEASRLVHGDVIAAAYVPMGHTYLDSWKNFDSVPLQAVFEKIETPQAIELPKEHKHPFASFFPAWRSRIGVKIKCTSACNACDLCGRNCPAQAIQNGKIHGGCIRCLRCVCQCPKSALSFRLHPVLNKYLNKKSQVHTKVY